MEQGLHETDADDRGEIERRHPEKLNIVRLEETSDHQVHIGWKEECEDQDGEEEKP